MRPFYIIFAVAIAGVYSESYSYQPPSQPLQLGSSSVPSLSQLPLSQGYNYPSPSSASSGIKSAVSFPSNGFDSSAFGSSPLGSSFQQGYNYESPGIGSNNIQSVLPNDGDLSPFGNAPQQDFSGSRNSFAGGNPLGQQSEQIQKHVYVYVAPPEQAVAETRQVYVPSPVVNHKIIFIKAPTQSSSKSNVIPLPPKSEEKTLVYVLVKKPEEHEVNVQPLPPQQASKPEVYFIKYNTKKGADNQGFPSGPLPGILRPGNGGLPGNGLPVVEDSFRGQKDPSSSHSFPQTSSVYGPPH